MAFGQLFSAMLKLNISKVYENDFSEVFYKRFIELGSMILIESTKPGERLYGLDWQHECFDFDPREGMKEPGLFVPGFIPDGDYYIFMTKDYKNCWFSHPWEESVTIYGELMVQAAMELIEEFEKIKIVKY